MAAVAPFALGLTACSIPSGQGFKIGVPFRQQTQVNYCVPASILMWRLWDGLPAVSQGSIWSWLGGPPCTADEIPAGITHFTNTFDSYLDINLTPSATEREHMVARQIQSVGENGMPVIPVVRLSKDHVGVINGGKYHRDGAVNVWDFVYFHDPANFFGDEYFGASEWLDYFCNEFDSHCAQVVSFAATSGWLQSLQTYGASVEPYGGCSGLDGVRRRCE